MILAFTGTQKGMTTEQYAMAKRFLRNNRITETHDGDCVGADAQFRGAVRWFNGRYCAPDPMGIPYNIPIETHSHPSDIPTMRAFEPADVIHEGKPPLVRNRNIVDASDYLLATPRTNKEILRSGTWATIRYARKVGKPVTIIYPSGYMEHFKERK